MISVVNKNGFLVWFLLTLMLFAFVDPFDIAIWRDRAYLLYMSQTISRGLDLYENTSFGYTPLTQILAGGLMWLIKKTSGEVDSIFVARVLGIILHALNAGSLYLLAKRIFKHVRAAHMVSLCFLSLYGLIPFSATNFEPKLLALLFEIWAIHFVLKERHLLSGALFSLAAMCWQPMVINCFALVAYLFIIYRWRKRTFYEIVLIGCGVFIGTIPVLFYMYMTEDWIYFWNQAVVRKVGNEGGVLFEAPFRWLRVVLTTKFRPDVLFLLMGGIGVLHATYDYIKSKIVREDKTKNSFLFLLIITIAWSFFNSMEFQGAYDFVPLLPPVLIFALFSINPYIEKLSANKFRLVVIVFVLYGFFDLAFVQKGMTFSEQKKLMADLQHKYGDPFVVNFEEYYVLTQKKIPIKYLRLALFEDYLINNYESNGCTDVLGQVAKLKPKVIISRVSKKDAVSSIGVCGQQIIDEYANNANTSFEVKIGRLLPLSSQIQTNVYEIYYTKYFDQ